MARTLKDSDLWWTPPEVVDLVRLLCPAGYVDLFGDAAGRSPLTRGARFAMSPNLDALDPTNTSPAHLPHVANPPWSQGWIAAAVEQLIKRSPLPANTIAASSILIAPLRLETQWARDFDPACVLVPRGRLVYTDENGNKPGSPRTSSGLYVRGRLSSRASEYLRANEWSVWAKAL